jgi:hypothetical protein
LIEPEEVYPAGALIQWGFSSTDKKDFPQLGKSFLAHVSRWFSVSSDLGTLLVQNRDAFDALIAGLVARAAALGLCEPIPTGCMEAARTEGWIVLPSKESLNQLVGMYS